MNKCHYLKGNEELQGQQLGDVLAAVLRDLSLQPGAEAPWRLSHVGMSSGKVTGVQAQS